MNLTDLYTVFKNYGKNTPLFSLNNIKAFIRVINVHDGDTITAVIPLFNSFYKFNIRINGIDTCEITSKNNVNKELALKARNRLIDIISYNNTIDKTSPKTIEQFFYENISLIWIECKDYDKYGRLLADLFTTEKLSIANILVSEKLAYIYHGQTKLTEEEQLIKFKS